MGAASASIWWPLAATLARSACRVARCTGLALALLSESRAGAALVVCQLHGGSRSALLGRLLNGRVDLSKPPVEIRDGMGLDIDPGGERCVLCLDGRCSCTTVAHMSGDQLSVDARRVDDGKAGDQRHEHQPPAPARSP